MEPPASSQQDFAVNLREEGGAFSVVGAPAGLLNTQGCKVSPKVLANSKSELRPLWPSYRLVCLVALGVDRAVLRLFSHTDTFLGWP